MNEDPAQKFYAQKSKDFLLQNEPFAVASLLLAVSPWIYVWFLPILLPVTASLAICSGIISLVRLSQTKKYQGRTLAISGILVGIIELIISLIIFTFFATQMLAALTAS